MYQIRPPQASEFENIAQFVFAQQARPEWRCLHLDWTLEGIRSDLSSLDQPFESAFRCAYAEDQLHGVLGCDLDLESGRAWLHGPFALQSDWQAISQALLAELWQRLSAEITRVSNYLERSHTAGLALHQANGFVQKGVSHIYRAVRGPTLAQASVREFTAADAEQVSHWHDLAFPKTWLSAAEMIAKADSAQPLRVIEHLGQAAGYLRLSRHESLSEASLDYLAVEPSLRGLGLGRQLLQAALHWAFAEQGLEQLFLNVDDSNTNARGLYESVGFELLQSGVALEWWRESV